MCVCVCVRPERRQLRWKHGRGNLLQRTTDGSWWATECWEWISKSDERGLYAGHCSSCSLFVFFVYNDLSLFLSCPFHCIDDGKAQKQVHTHTHINGMSRWARRETSIAVAKKKKKKKSSTFFWHFVASICVSLRKRYAFSFLMSLCACILFLLENRPYPLCNKPKTNNKKLAYFFFSPHIYDFHLIVAFDSIFDVPRFCLNRIWWFRYSKQRPSHKLKNKSCTENVQTARRR